MKKLMAFTLVCTLTIVSAQRISESLDNWTLGTTPPEISSGTRGDGTTGNYLHMLVGTSPMYYEVMMEGEGLVDFWVYDPGNCLENPDPGYGTNGPRWGLQSPLYQSCSVGIGRATYVSGCLGYSPWSTVSPYSYTWYKDGLRASKDIPWTPGWYQWAVAGTWDNISFTIYNVTYYVIDKMVHDPGDEIVTGDYIGTFDATTYGGMWAALFGEGWKAYWCKGDASSGIEDVNIDVTGGSGVFNDFGESPISKPYIPTSWGNVKNLYR